jgi:hypothetical protein
MVKLLSPCMDRYDRYIGCHGICDRYKAYTEEHEKLKESIRKQKFVHNSIKDMHKEQYERYKRNRHKNS